jgi:hypothetical protein
MWRQLLKSNNDTIWVRKLIFIEYKAAEMALSCFQKGKFSYTKNEREIPPIFRR